MTNRSGRGAYIQGFLSTAQRTTSMVAMLQFMSSAQRSAISCCGTRKTELRSGLLYRLLWNNTATSGFRFKLHYVIKERTWPAAPPLSVKEGIKHNRKRVRNGRGIPQSLPEILVKQISGTLAKCFETPVW